MHPVLRALAYVFSFSVIAGVAAWAGTGAESTAADLSACQTGDQESCLRGARSAQAAGDNALLQVFSETGCAHGNVISCSDEGMLIIAGLNPEGDLQRAVTLVQQGCERDYARACTNLGYLHFTGTAVSQSPEKAASYYRRGCDGGSAAGCRNLGLMVAQGDVPQKGLPSVDELFDRACELGDVTAC